MTDEMLSRLVSSQILDAMERNQDAIVRELADCLNPGESVDPVTVRLVTRAIRLSTHLSTQLVIRILDSAGVIHLPPDGTPLLYDLSNEE